MLKLNIHKLFLLLIILTNLCLASYYLIKKEMFHCDEIFSHTLANNSTFSLPSEKYNANITFWQVPYIDNTPIPSNALYSFLTVQPHNRFNYKSVYEILATDVHPPLFYLLVHTICSFFPNVFNKWQIGILNLFISIFLLHALYKLALLILKDKKLALLSVAFYAFSNACISMEIFLRMYLLQTLFATCLFYQISKLIENNSATKKDYFLIFLYSFLGIFTQYSSLIFSFILSVLSGLILLYRKNYKTLIKLAFTMILSVTLIPLLFPATLNILFNSERGSAAVSALQNFNHQQLTNLFNYNRFIKIYFNQLFSIDNFSHNLSFIILFISLVIFIIQIKQHSTSTQILLYTSISIALFIELILPDMGIYDLRYFSLIMPTISVLTIYFFNTIFTNLNINKKSSLILIAILVIINTLTQNFSTRSTFAFQTDDFHAKLNQDLKNKNLVFINIIDPVVPISGMKYTNYLYKLTANDASLRNYENEYNILKKGTLIAAINHLGEQFHSYRDKIRLTNLEKGNEKYIKYKYSFRKHATHFDIYEIIDTTGFTQEYNPLTF